ncbi:hypothetical protein EGW08_022662 [Elysia chlorotica]|uniref:Uncharacterized protein n=1 Tax=Elysia chlorotica TaxID=188477 RepID=A0A433SKD2_ELYCH|nr:hypothetical protein EGW08_022662 [Elysia chlorotica]
MKAVPNILAICLIVTLTCGSTAAISMAMKTKTSMIDAISFFEDKLGSLENQDRYELVRSTVSGAFGWQRQWTYDLLVCNVQDLSRTERDQEWESFIYDFNDSRRSFFSESSRLDDEELREKVKKLLEKMLAEVEQSFLDVGSDITCN